MRSDKARYERHQVDEQKHVSESMMMRYDTQFQQQQTLVGMAYDAHQLLVFDRLENYCVRTAIGVHLFRYMPKTQII